MTLCCARLDRHGSTTQCPPDQDGDNLTHVHGNFMKLHSLYNGGRHALRRQPYKALACSIHLTGLHCGSPRSLHPELTGMYRHRLILLARLVQCKVYTWR